MTSLLHLAEHRVQEAALAFMAVVYAVRVIWLFRFPSARDRQPPTGWPRTNAVKGAWYSMAAIGMPWSMESTRTKPGFYAQFVVFHLAIAANILLSFVIPYASGLLQSVALMRLLQVVIGAGFVAGVIRMVRRVSDPVVRRISTPDDIFSLGLLTVWFLAGVTAAPNSVGRGELHLVVYFLLTAFFLIYVPFSKISHYLYYPFTRYWLGRTLGYRGVFPIEHVGGSASDRVGTPSPRAIAADLAQGPS